MKEMFPGFYSPTDEQIDAAWKGDNTLFVFDTNTLLNLYGYADQTRQDFFSILDEISDRIWLPYHVVLEYQRRRLSVIKNEKAVFRRIGDILSKVENLFESDFRELDLDRRFPTLDENTDKLYSDIKKLFSAYRKSVTYWDNKQPCVRGHDLIRESLNDYFLEKVGAIPEDQASLNKFFEEGDKRYQNNVPPGYKDLDKDKRGGDLFMPV